MLVAAIRQLTYRHPKQQNDLLTDINFTIQSGSKIGIIGVNGCGKSTLMRLVKQEIMPDSGQIYFV